MELTNKLIEQKGFKRINNSIWRSENITLQNGWTHEGNNIYEKILNTKKAYKVCIDGKYRKMIHTLKDLDDIISREKLRQLIKPQ